MLTFILMSLGHFSVDLYSGALGALQPLLVDRFGMSLTQAGILGGTLLLSSSVLQPVYGFISDRFHTRAFTVLAPAVAGIFISALGLVPSFGWLLPMVLLGGTGIAAFHPQASARVAFGTAERRGSAMAVFISAGTLGYSVGPAVFSIIASTFGLSGTYWAALLGILVSVFLVKVLPPAPAPSARARSHFDWKALHAVWKPLTLLYVLVFIRSIVQITFGQFLSLYLHMERGLPVNTANFTLSAYLAAGALGGFIGGHLADRFGGRSVIIASMGGAVPFLALFFFGSGWLSLVGLVVGGFVLLFTIPVNVVMAQELVPSQAGTVSALMMGFAWGAAGLVFIPLTGWASDHFSMHNVLASLMVFPVLGFFLAMKLKK
ncbi:MAG: MFS transporter [Bryobacteraceae bacterium]